MLSSLLSSLFKIIFKEYYRSKLALIFELVSILTSLVIYYYTSLAFGSNVNELINIPGMDYFSFIIIGDIILTLPVYFIEGASNSLKKAHIDGTYYTYRQFLSSETKAIFNLLLINITPIIFRLSIMTTIFILISYTSVSIVHLILCILLSAVLFIPFIFLGLSIFFFTGRGSSIMAYFTTLLSIFSGGYFPISLLPSPLNQISQNLNPLTHLLSFSRDYAWHLPIQNDYQSLLYSGLILLILNIPSLLILNKALKYRKKKGTLRVFISR